MSVDGVPPDDDLRAAELALGLADAATRSEDEARLETDPAFAAAHAHWIAYALTLSAVRPERPDAALWPRIAARIAADDAGHPPTVRHRGIAVAAGVVAAFLLGLAGGHLLDRRTSAPVSAPLVPAPPVASRPLVAVLTGPDRAGVVAVSFDPVDGHLTSTPKSVDPGRRVLELWVIPAGGAPDAIGVVPHGGASWRRVPSGPGRLLRAGATLAVSLEPIGGSPTGRPTGPVILTGALAEPG